jgi:hypothetical protein
LSRNLDKNVFIAKKPGIKQGLPVEKKTLITAAFLSLLLMSTVNGIQLVDFVRANPYSQARYVGVPEGEIPPPNGTKPHAIHIFSPKNNTAINSYNFTLAFNVSAPMQNINNVYLSLFEVYYKASWLSGISYVDLKAHNSGSNFSIHIAGVPNGNNTITVYAVGTGMNETWRRYENAKFPPTVYIYFLGFSVVGSSIVSFTVDTIRPRVSILSYQNRTYNTPDIPLNLAVNENAASITYSLDGQDNVTVYGNTTLRGLPNGDHNVTVYATDKAGNIGTSETIHFKIKSLPTTLVVVPITSVAVGVGLLVYFKKRKR